jgi:hypothetical protein
MYHADDQNGDLVTREMAERVSCIGNPLCYSSPYSAESHFAENFPTAFASHGMTGSKLPDAEGTSCFLCSENLDSASAITNIQFEPGGRQARDRNERPRPRPEGVGDGEHHQAREAVQKSRLALLEELADILACIFAEVQTTSRLDAPVVEQPAAYAGFGSEKS